MAVRWYLRYGLSYRDVEELLAERGLRADHDTVWRWVQRYAAAAKRFQGAPDQRQSRLPFVLGSLAYEEPAMKRSI